MNCKEFKNLIPKWENNELLESNIIEFYKHFAYCNECLNEIEKKESANFANSLDTINNTVAYNLLEKKVFEVIKEEKQRKTSHKFLFFKMVGMLFLTISLTILTINYAKNNSNDNKLSIKWKYNLKHSNYSTNKPVVMNDKIFAVDSNKKNKFLVACNKDTGKHIWRKNFNIYGNIIAGKNAIYTSSINHNKLEILSLNNNGNTNWTFDCTKLKKSLTKIQLHLIENTLYWTEKQTLYSLNTKNGHLNWQIQLSKNNGLLSNPLIYSTQLFIAGRDKLFAINASNGSIVKSKILNKKSSMFIRPIITKSNNYLYLLSKPVRQNGLLQCYNIATLSQK